ncbi:cytochrome P450 [Fomitopsis betulina]|nr:cytochrome P450 [Fomitopsis betulina]
MSVFNLNILLPVAGTILVYAFWALVPWYINWYKSSVSTIPGPPCRSWLYGDLRELRGEEPGVMLQRWAERYGHVFKFTGTMAAERVVMLDAKGINHILTHSHDYPKPEVASFHLSQIVGKGAWVSNPAFGPAQIRGVTDIFVDKARQLRDVWLAEVAAAAGGSVQLDVVNGLNNMTLDVIGLAGFNYEFHALNQENKPNELRHAFDDMFRAVSGEGLSTLSLLQNYFPILRLIPNQRATRTDAAQGVARRIGMQLISEKKAAILRAAAASGDEKEISGKSLVDRDLLTLLIKANMSTDIPEAQRLSDEDMLAQVPTFLIAGHETTSTATAWCLFALAQSPDVQARLREELLDAPLEDPTMDELNALPYLEAVVRETLRVYAPVSATVRIANKDDIIPLDRPYVDTTGKVCDHIRAPKGTRFSIPIIAINRSKDLWGADANEFKPERWISGSVPDAAHHIPGVWGNLLTFLGGPRACIGYRFSLVEMKALLFMLIRAFEFELALPKEAITKLPGIVDRPFLKNDMKKGAMLPLKVKAYLRTE